MIKHVIVPKTDAVELQAHLHILVTLVVWWFPAVGCCQTGPGVFSHKHVHHIHFASGLLRQTGPSRHPFIQAKSGNPHLDLDADYCWIGLRSNWIIHSNKEPLPLAASIGLNRRILDWRGYATGGGRGKSWRNHHCGFVSALSRIPFFFLAVGVC